MAQALGKTGAQGQSLRQPARQALRRELALDEAGTRDPGGLRRLDARRHPAPAALPGPAPGSGSQDRGARGTSAYGGNREVKSGQSQGGGRARRRSRHRRPSPPASAARRPPPPRTSGPWASASRIRTACCIRTTASPSCSLPNISRPWARHRHAALQGPAAVDTAQYPRLTSLLPEAFPRGFRRRPARRADPERGQGSGLRGLRFASKACCIWRRWARWSCIAGARACPAPPMPTGSPSTWIPARTCPIHRCAMPRLPFASSCRTSAWNPG